MKPRIKVYALGHLWQCFGYGMIGVGRTPLQAFLAWNDGMHGDVPFYIVKRN